MTEKKEIILSCKSISKSFGPTHALKSVSFEARKGTIHGLIGENGSGKSTLTSIFAGILSADCGEMKYLGEKWNPASVLWAEEKGVRAVVQEMGTISNLSVAENLFLGKENRFRKGAFIDKFAMHKEAKKALDYIGADYIDPSIQIGTLNMQERKIVEIAKAVYGEVNLLIIDETTTALSHTGRDLLYKLMRRVSDEGACVILITHDMDELIEQCDLTTILRDGEIVGSIYKNDFNPDKIRQMMIGRELDGNYYRDDKSGYQDEVVLKAENITTLKELMNFNLELHKGEILGIGGLSHCGMHTLGRALFGAEPVLNGRVVMQEKNIVIETTTVASENGIGYLSKERDTESLSINAPIYENIASTGYKINKAFKFFISWIKEKKYVNDQISNLSIKCVSMNEELNNLSGGNKQKVAFGKWVARDSDILILDCPTRGVDVGVKAAMYELIAQMKKDGKSIVLISEELPELMGMSDRLIILKDGIQTREFYREKGFAEHEIINYMI